MTADRDQWAESLATGRQGGWLTSFIADEAPFDQRAKWRLASWAVGAVSALTIAILAGQNAAVLHSEKAASVDLLDRQAKQIQSVARETQTESQRISAAISTLNSDRDRLFARVTSVEQGLDSVTGSVKRQTMPAAAASLPPIPSDPPPVTAKPVPSVHVTATAPTPAPAASPPPIGPVASALPIEPPVPKPTPAMAAPLFEPPTPLMDSKSIIAPPDSGFGKFRGAFAPHPVAATPAAAAPPPVTPEKVASIEPPSPKPEPPPAAKAEVASIPVPRTEFGVDLGGANSVEGLRALWRGLTASNKTLADLRPIITIKERIGGYGMQLRLVAGPLNDAAAAAQLCAGLKLGERTCETSVYDGQRLAVKTEPQPKEPALNPAPKVEATPKPAGPMAVKPAPVRRRTNLRQELKREPAVEQTAIKPADPAPAPPPPKPSGLSSMLGISQ